MTSVLERCRLAGGEHVFICDFSPPRGADPTLLSSALDVPADFISVAYNPGKSPRLNPVFAAQWISQESEQGVLFTLSTRDMNRMAIQGLLLGADLVGLENVVIVKGDPYVGQDLEWAITVDDFRTSELIVSIENLNAGIDFRGLTLRSPTGFCVGATIDLSVDIERQVRLARRKVEAGTKYFLLQALFEPERLTAFVEAYDEAYGDRLDVPIFCGVQILVPDGVTFGKLPQRIIDEVDKGRDGVDIAVDLIARYADAGFTDIYLLPSIFKGGRRDYESATRVLREFGR